MSVVKGLALVEFYLAQYIDTTTSTYGKPIRNYDTPILLKFNVKPLSDSLDLSAYGERISRMYKAVIPNTETNRDLFIEGSIAYLEGATPTGETNNGDNGNYLIVGNRPYNHSLHIYFEKLESRN